MSLYFDRLRLIQMKNNDSLSEGVFKLTREILRATKSNSNIWLLGNGGSASTVQHFENDLLFLREPVSFMSNWPKNI